MNNNTTLTYMKRYIIFLCAAFSVYGTLQATESDKEVLQIKQNLDKAVNNNSIKQKLEGAILNAITDEKLNVLTFLMKSYSKHLTDGIIQNALTRLGYMQSDFLECLLTYANIEGLLKNLLFAEGKTFLIYAMDRLSEEVIRILLDKMAELKLDLNEQKDSEGKSAFMHVMKKPQLLVDLLKYNPGKGYSSKRINLNKPDYQGVFVEVISQNDQEKLQLLLQYNPEDEPKRNGQHLTNETLKAVIKDAAQEKYITGESGMALITILANRPNLIPLVNDTLFKYVVGNKGLGFWAKILMCSAEQEEQKQLSMNNKAVLGIYEKIIDKSYPYFLSFCMKYNAEHSSKNKFSFSDNLLQLLKKAIDKDGGDKYLDILLENAEENAFKEIDDKIIQYAIEKHDRYSVQAFLEKTFKMNYKVNISKSMLNKNTTLLAIAQEQLNANKNDRSCQFIVNILNKYNGTDLEKKDSFLNKNNQNVDNKGQVRAMVSELMNALLDAKFYEFPQLVEYFLRENKSFLESNKNESMIRYKFNSIIQKIVDNVKLQDPKLFKLLLEIDSELLKENQNEAKKLSYIDSYDFISTLLEHLPAKIYDGNFLKELIFFATSNGKANSLRAFLESPKFDPNILDEDKRSILISSMLSYSLEVVRVLFASKKDMRVNYQVEEIKNGKKIKQYTALMLLVGDHSLSGQRLKNAVEIADILLQNGANPNLLNTKKQGAFTMALQYPEIAEKILKHDKFKLKTIYYDNNTILHLLVKEIKTLGKGKKNNDKVSKLKDMLKYVLEKNEIDLQWQDSKGHTVIDIAHDESIKNQLQEAMKTSKPQNTNSSKGDNSIFSWKNAKIVGIIMLIFAVPGGVVFFIKKKYKGAKRIDDANNIDSANNFDDVTYDDEANDFDDASHDDEANDFDDV